MKLATLLENRTELLHLQQCLIDDLPDNVNVDLVHEPRLGEVICIEMPDSLGYLTKRFVKSSSIEGHINYVPNSHVSWTLFSYDGIIRLFTKIVSSNQAA